MLIGIDLMARQFLQAQTWFAGLKAEDRQRLEERTRTLQVRKGALLLEQGEQEGGWYAVLCGLVMLESAPTGQRRSAFMGVPDGEWFGEGTALKNEPRRYSVLALRDSWLLQLPQAEFQRLQAEDLGFNRHLVAHLNMRLGQAMTLIETGRMRSPEHRVALYLSRQFWRSTRRLHLTQEELGQLVGLSRQTVNRALKGLAEQGIVTLDLGRVEIQDDVALSRYLSQQGL